MSSPAVEVWWSSGLRLRLFQDLKVQGRVLLRVMLEEPELNAGTNGPHDSFSPGMVGEQA